MTAPEPIEGKIPESKADKITVFFRFNLKINDKDVEVFFSTNPYVSRIFESSREPMSLLVTPLDKPGKPEVAEVTALWKKDSICQGWFSTELESGSHHLIFESFLDTDPTIYKNYYMLYLPLGISKAYIGSLNLSCEGTKSFLGINWDTNCPAIKKVIDETANAKRVISTIAPEAKDISTSLLQPVQDKYRPTDKSAIFPMVVAPETSGLWYATSNPNFVGQFIGKNLDDLEDSSLSDALGITGFLFSGGAGPYPMAGLYPPGQIAVGLTYLFCVSFGTLSGAIEGSAEQEKWMGCIPGLKNKLLKNPPPDMLTEILLEKFSDYEEVLPSTNSNYEAIILETDMVSINGGPSQSHQANSVLKTDLRKIMLRECEDAGLYCVELVVRSTLFLDDELIPAFDKVYLYNWLRKIDKNCVDHPHKCIDPTYVVYEESIVKRPKGAPLEKYCNDEGVDFFYGEIRKGLEAITLQLLEDLGLNNTR